MEEQNKTENGTERTKNKNQGKYDAEVKLQPTGAPEGKNKETERQAIFAEIMPETLLDPYTQELLKISSWVRVQVVMRWMEES